MPGDLLPFQATETTLSNGLRVIVVPTGFARFFEHAMFRGTKAYPPGACRAIRRRLSAGRLTVVMITKDADGLAKGLLSPSPPTIAYDAPKPPEVLAEDEVIGIRNLGLTPERVRVAPVTDVFAR